MRIVILTLVAAYLLLMLALFAFQRRILFPRGMANPLPDAGMGIAGLEKVWIDSPEGRVEGWFLACPGASQDSPAPLVLFAHGNAELIDYWPQELEEYRKMGFHLFLPEYRGYGRSAGSPSQDAITEDFIQFYDGLIARPQVDARRIVFHGRSLGGGAVCALAEQRKPAAIILQSTYTSVAAFASRFLAPRFIVRDPFDNLATVSKLDVPILILHGRHDEVIPFRHGKKLHAAAKHAKLVAYDCGHNDFPPDWDVFWKDIREFLAEKALLPLLQHED
jgi:fermentation-respiration switch protein FrsA (DUF1100 family)